MLPSQEEIKIISADVFVNPYAESDDEEEGKTVEDDKNVKDEDNVSFRLLTRLYSNSATLSAFQVYIPLCVMLITPFGTLSRKRSVHGTAIRLLVQIPPLLAVESEST